MKVCFFFHGNLNYSNMPIERRDWVIDASYGALLDFWKTRFPGQKWSIEHAGWDVEYMAQHTPHIIKAEREQLGKSLEFVGAPYAHSILPNFPYEDGVHALKFGMEAYERILDCRPRVLWNPEGAWNSDVPKMALATGYDGVFVDWDSYLRCNDAKIRAAEDDGERTRLYADLDDANVDPSAKTLHFPLIIQPGLKAVMRTDRVSRHMLRYLMDDTEIDMQGILKNYTAANEGYLVVYAEDAEYCGTTGWYFMKYHQLKNSFDPIPQSFDRLERIVGWALEAGHELVHLSDVLDNVPVLDTGAPFHLEDGMAWHGTYAEAWASTPPAKEMDPECDKVRERIRRAEAAGANPEKVKQAWKHLVCAENSDGRWPPPPVNPADWNLEFCWSNLRDAAAVMDQLGF